MNRTPRTRRATAGLFAGGLLMATLLGLAACSGGSLETADTTVGSDSDAGGGGSSAFAEEAPGATAAQPGVARGSAADTTATSATPSAQPAVIQTGTLTVESDDVAKARFDLGKVVDARDGSIADEETTADSEGEVELSRVVLRVPSAAFDDTLVDLADLGKVTDSTRKAQDVTGEVIDTRARIRAQEQSLARVQVLFQRAQDIRDIVAIEAQLSSRQAELDSLKGRLAYLEDQTTLSTITVYLEATSDRPAVKADEDNAFVGGLTAGWRALAALGGGLATVGGALLPFAVVALLLGVPAWLVLRRWLARHSLRRTPTAAPTVEA